MVPLRELDAESILSDAVLTEVFDQEDELYKARLLLSLEDRAAELGVKKKFQELVKAYKRIEREMRRKEREKPKKQLTLVDNWTNFDGPYDRMQCRSWVASDDGVYSYNTQSGNLDVLACYHPILPLERLKNLETGEEQIKLAYKRNGRWDEIIVPKTMITSANKIVALSGRGIAVTSENAKNLVKYLADVENANDDYIRVQYSSSKLGWIKGGFLPYDTEIIFDGDVRHRQVAESVGTHGNRERWYEHIRSLRRSGRMEIKFMLAASFASVLVSLVGGLPFFVDLWGETEGGKTVTLMLAASVWACPDEHAYIKDYSGSEVGLEVLCDLLNHLPLILDDTSKRGKKLEDNFEGLVYDLCSGKGKTRSNKDLGLNRESNWKNCILTNGERPLNSYVSQGGAINRILELEAGENIFSDVAGTLDVIKHNYGFAGKEFVETVKKLGESHVREIQQEIFRQLADDEKMQKQSLSLSIVLTADRIATDYLFKDHQYISIDEAKEVLIDRNELSDNERCYRYLLDKVQMNPQRFETLDARVEQWGVLQDGYAVIFSTAFDALCREGGYSKKSFLSWANRKGLLLTEKSRLDKTKKINNRTYRCVFLRMDDSGPEEEGDFVEISEEEQGELPFL